MGLDVTTLGMAVDSSGVRRATDDLDKMTGAGNRAAKSGSDVETSFTGQVLIAQQLDRAIASVVNTTVDLVKGFVNLGLSVGKYQDIAERLSMEDPAGLASLQVAADVAGQSLESVAGAINRMQLQIDRASDSSKPAARALASIGVSIEDFRRLAPDEQYRKLAEQLDKYADGQSKVAIAQALFGRGGAQQLVMLKELAGETDRVTILSRAQIKYADDLSDSLTRNASTARLMAGALAVQTLPALDAVVKTTREAIAKLLGVDQAGADLTKSNTVALWADNTAKTLGFMVDAGDGVVRVFGAVGLTIGAAAAQAVAVAKLNFREAKLIGDEWKKDLADLADKPLFSTQLEANLAIARARAAAAASKVTEQKPDSGFRGATEKALAAEKDAYEQVLAAAQKRLAQEALEDDLGRKLTAGEKLLADAYDELAKKHRALTDEENLALENLAAQADLSERNNKARKDEQKWMDDSIRQSAQFLDGQEKQLSMAEALARSAEEELANFGKTTEELKRLEIARLRDAAAQLRAKQMVEDFNPEAKLYNELLNQQADALDRAADARSRLNNMEERAKKDPKEGAKRGVEQYLKGIEDVGTETQRVVSESMQNLEDDLTKGLATGRLDFKSTIDYMIQEALRLAVIRPILQSLFGGGSGAGGGAGGLGGLLGGAGSLFGTLFGGGSSIGGIGFGTGAGFGNLDLGGFFAEGGRPPVGKDIVVGEKGPEVLRLDQPGTIIPNSKIGAGSPTVTYAPVIRIDSRTDQAQIAKIVNSSLEENNRAFISQLKAAGVV